MYSQERTRHSLLKQVCFSQPYLWFVNPLAYIVAAEAATILASIEMLKGMNSHFG